MPEHPNRERLRETFGTVAELYDRARPEYPAVVFDDLAELAQLEAGSRVLEIGPGTGKATVELVRRGYEVSAVELSADLAAVARRNVPEAAIVTADFEDWEPDGRGFDAIVAFTAFHWIAPAARYTKTARVLEPGGALAVVIGVHVLPAGGDPFFAEVQEDYDAVVPHPDNRAPRRPEEIESEWADEFRAAGAFEHVEERRHLVALRYTADEYVAVLGTFSDNLALPAEKREELFRRIHARIEARGDSIRKHYLLILTVGRTPRTPTAQRAGGQDSR